MSSHNKPSNYLWKLYIDDLRTPVDESFFVVRNMKEAQILIQQYRYLSIERFEKYIEEKNDKKSLF